MALATGILQFNVESAQELRRIGELAAGHGRDRAGGAARQSRTSTPARTRRSAPAASTTSSASPTRRRRPSIALAAELAGHRAGRRASAHRLADRPARAVRGGLPARRRAVHEPASRGHPAAPARPRRRLRRALSGRAARGGRRPWRALVRRVTAGLDCELLFEPGRALVAEAGVILSSVIYLKEAGGRRFLVLDFGHARPDPAGDVWCAPPRPAGARAGAGRSRWWRWMWWGRSARAATCWAVTACCPSWRRAIWSRSPVPAPTGR